jgi:hypothetical protein
MRFDERTVILPADAIVHCEVLEGVHGVWRDPEAGAENVRHPVRLAETESAMLHAPSDWTRRMARWTLDAAPTCSW